MKIVKKINRKFLSDRTRRGMKNSLYLTIGQVISKVITFAGFLYIPNRLGSHDYGLYATALAFVGLFSVLSFTGTTKVILREASKDLNNVKKIIGNTFNLKLLLSIFQIIIIAIAAILVKNYDWNLKLLIFIASNEAFFRSLRPIPKAIIQAEEKMKLLATIEVIKDIIRICGTVGLLVIINNLFVIMIYRAVVNFVFLFIYYKNLKKIIHYSLNFNLKKIKLPKKLLKEAAIFSIIGVGGILSLKIDVAMISWLGNPSEVGVYGLSQKIVVQLEMVRGIVLTAFFPLFIKRFNQGKVKLKKLFQITCIIFLGTLILAVLFSLIADNLITMLYSVEYEQVGSIIVVLVFYLVFFFSNLPMGTSIQSVGLEKYLLLMYPFTIIINIVLNYFLYKEYGVIGFAYSTLAVQGFIFIYLLSIGSYQLKKIGAVK